MGQAAELFVCHKYPRINLPIWFLDKPSGVKQSDLQISMAVNGQTGKAAALFLKVGKRDYARAGKDYIRTLESSPPAQLSDESTLYSRPMAVKFAKQLFLYKTYHIEEVLGKPKSKLSRWLRG